MFHGMLGNPFLNMLESSSIRQAKARLFLWYTAAQMKLDKQIKTQQRLNLKAAAHTVLAGGGEL